jgi:2-dehydro-3-deoxygalactonokinase
MIAVDWGTSNLRLYRMSDSGDVLERRRCEGGLFDTPEAYAELLRREIQGWDDRDIVLSGMVGSRSGWLEMPYQECPVSQAELAAGMQRFAPAGFEDRRLWLIPGVCDRQSASVPDVMRGEETQIAALLDALPGGTHVICLPGTHSKWVTVRDGRIISVATAMTGELFAVLRNHSILGKLMSPEDRFDAYAFDAGLRRSAEAGGWLQHLFSVRTAGLFREFSDTALPSYLSGILIGHEIRASDLLTRVPRPAQVHLVGSDRLLASYAHALTTLGLGVQRHSEHLAAVGMAKLLALVVKH